MPAYSFQEMFCPMVKDGTKNQTIRSRRKKGFAKVADQLYLYYGMRTKWCTKLKQAVCKKAGTVLIRPDNIIVLWEHRLTDDEVKWILKNNGATDGKRLIDRVLLNQKDIDQFAWLDGFRPEGTTLKKPTGAFNLMMSFWNKTHQLPFVGDIIYW